MREYTHKVTDVIEDKTRLLDYAIGVFPLLPTKSSVKKAIKRRELWIDNVQGYSGDYIRQGMTIYHRIPQEEVAELIDIDIAYEDDFLLIVNKPPGILSSGQGKVSIQKALIQRQWDSIIEDAYLFPKLIHRLDRDTSGLLIAAKTKSTHLALSQMLEAHAIKKKYAAIVEGCPKSPLWIDDPIDGQEAMTNITSVKKLQTKDTTSLCTIELVTGRTHQIRVHMKGIGHPIVGDHIYNKEGISFGRGLFLQASSIRFNHPETSDIIEVEVPLHKKFEKYKR